ncbi:hypothetical protein SUGI_1493280 [Cryptomeria japonica]|uniref:Uncharacterized protein n=1 Tax=Cryptomeria japonica TaxID=3369 RepID=A0AAD3RRF2_CRYJA|nr:hypothetical protein SUGI_1493280 [Cryptomeria japonica]
MQQNTPAPPNRTFVDERYKQMKELNDEQAKQMINLESQLFRSLERNRELAEETRQFQKQLEFRTKLKEPGSGEFWSGNQDLSRNASDEINGAIQATTTANNPSTPDERLEDNTTRLSPSASIKDGSQTNSSSSIDGYVHLKPTTFEIVSRSSVLEDAQIQIDNLTKAYLDSESTNSLLSEQVKP